MSAAEAHLLLDAAKAGLEVSREQIIRALMATGDMGLPERFYLPIDSSEPAIFTERLAA